MRAMISGVKKYSPL